MFGSPSAGAASTPYAARAVSPKAGIMSPKAHTSGSVSSKALFIVSSRCDTPGGVRPRGQYRQGIAKGQPTQIVRLLGGRGLTHLLDQSLLVEARRRRHEGEPLIGSLADRRRRVDEDRSDGDAVE